MKGVSARLSKQGVQLISPLNNDHWGGVSDPTWWKFIIVSDAVSQTLKTYSPPNWNVQDQQSWILPVLRNSWSHQCWNLRSSTIIEYLQIFAYLYKFWTSAPPHCCLRSSPRRCFFILFYLDLWKVATSVWRLTSGAKSHLQKIQRCRVDSCWSSRSRVRSDRIHRNMQTGKWCEP